VIARPVAIISRITGSRVFVCGAVVSIEPPATSWGKGVLLE
jgi:hypothetical protein